MTADDEVPGEAIPDPIEKLTPVQLDALEALLAGATDAAAAEAAGVVRTTVSRWKNHDPEFKAAYNAARLKRAERIQNRLWSRIDELADTVLEAALDDGDARMAMQLLKRLGAFREVRREDKITDPEVIRIEQLLRAWQLSNIKAGRQILGEIEHGVGVVQVLRPGHGCLWCCGFLSSDRIRAESLSPEERQALEAEGYLVGIDESAPSIVTVTTTVAALASTWFIQLATDFMGEAGDLSRQNYDLLTGEVRRGRISPQQTCVCQKVKAKGDLAEIPV